MATIRKGAPDGFEVTIPIFLSLAFGWQIHLTMMRWKRRNGETMARRFTTWTLTSGSLVGRWTLAGRSSSAFMEPVGGEIQSSWKSRHPLLVGMLGNSWRSITFKKGKVVQEEVDNWRLREGNVSRSWWCGITEFDLIDAGALEASVAAKKGQDEVNLKDEPEAELEGWKQADDSEWAKIVANGAVKVLSLDR